MTTQLKRLPPLALCALAAAIGGMLGGATAVHGLHQNPYGPTSPPLAITRSVETVSDAGYADTGSSGSDTAGCADCSERDLGYRWATLQAIHSPAECPNDSWGFRRGCLDYTGGI